MGNLVYKWSMMQCPHCLQHFHESWIYTPLAQDTVGTWGVGRTICAACGRIIITLGQLLQAVARGAQPTSVPNPPTFRLVYPKGISRSPIPSEVPPEFA